MRVVVADDAVPLREGLALPLEEAGFEVAGLAAAAGQLLELVKRTHPDVAIVDIRMPPARTGEGLQAATAIRGRWLGVGILVLSQHVHAGYAVDLLSAGTDGGTCSRSASRPGRARLERAAGRRQELRCGPGGGEPARLGGGGRPTIGSDS